MQKPLTTVFQLLAAGMMLLGNAPAQQTPAATTTQPASAAPATQAAPAKTPSAAAKKPATTAKPAAAPLTLKTQKQKASRKRGLGKEIEIGIRGYGIVLTGRDAAVSAGL